MHLSTYLVFLAQLESNLGASYRTVSAGYPDDNDVFYATGHCARECDGRATSLRPVIEQYRTVSDPASDRLGTEPMTAARGGPLGMLRDLQDLYQLASLVDITWTLVGQAAYGARDRQLIEVVHNCAPQVTTQLDWLRMRMKAAAPQTLLVGI